eukprot:260492_1
MSQARVVAYLEAPILTEHVKYSDYLQEFRHFLDFLRNNEDVASAQTMKRPVQPSVASIETTMKRLPVRHVKKPEPVQEDSDSLDEKDPIPTPPAANAVPTSLSSVDKHLVRDLAREDL